MADWAFDNVQDEVFANAAGPGLSAKSAGETAIADAPDGKALELSGEGWAGVAHDAKLDLCEGFALAAWICPGELPETGARIIDKIPVGTDTGYLLDTFPGDALRVITSRGSLDYDAHLAPGEWRHVAAKLDPGGELRLYVDGKRVASRQCEAPPGVELFERIRELGARLVDAGLGECYEARHAGLAIDALAAIRRRRELLAEGDIRALPEPSQAAADKSYVDTAVKLAQGLASVVESYSGSEDAHQKRVHAMWLNTRR